jgi:hypothetical protein
MDCIRRFLVNAGRLPGGGDVLVDSVKDGDDFQRVHIPSVELCFLNKKSHGFARGIGFRSSDPFASQVTVAQSLGAG